MRNLPVQSTSMDCCVLPSSSFQPWFHGWKCKASFFSALFFCRRHYLYFLLCICVDVHYGIIMVFLSEFLCHNAWESIEIIHEKHKNIQPRDNMPFVVVVFSSSHFFIHFSWQQNSRRKIIFQCNKKFNELNLLQFGWWKYFVFFINKAQLNIGKRNIFRPNIENMYLLIHQVDNPENSQNP